VTAGFGDIVRGVDALQYKLRGQPHDHGATIERHVKHYLSQGYPLHEATKRARQDLGLQDMPGDYQLNVPVDKMRWDDQRNSKVAAPVYQNTPVPQAQMQMGPQQGQGQLMPATMPQQGHCPYCGGTTTADGSCPQCGATVNPQGGATPPGQQPASPYNPVSTPAQPPMPGAPGMYTGSVLDQHVLAADHQGPTTPEQISAVQALLIDQGRAEETPNVPIEPWNYVREMAQIAQQQNIAPNVDPNAEQPQPPPMPAQEVAPPGATMPVPNPADPSMMPMMAHTAAGKDHCSYCGRKITWHQSGFWTGHAGSCEQQNAAPDATREQVYSHTAADNIAPRCPDCGSATTGITGGDYDGTKSATCHACGKVWEIDNTVREKIGAENVVGVPAADQEGQHDIEQEQDSSHTWKTGDGEPLHVGQEYEVHSPEYEIPDIVKIDTIKPDSLVVSTIGEYQPGDTGQPTDGAPLTYQREITREEAELGQYQFVPSGGDSQAGEQSLEEYQNREQAPVNTEPTPTPQIDPRLTYVEASAPEEPELPDDKCPACMSAHVSSELSSPTTSFHECYKCGKVWETKEEDYIDQNTANRQWIMDDSGPGGDDFWSGYEKAREARESGASRNLSDIAARDPRYQEIRERLDANHHEAGRKFTPREQREFIDEQGVARNADKLNLAGTHYESHRYLGDKANADNAPDEHMFLGL
jgi:DNA-directed RNA polymerase subunit M/transcription elongation factor TFIIS